MGLVICQSDTQSKDNHPQINLAFDVMYQDLDIELVEGELLGSINLCIRIIGIENDSGKEVLFITVSIKGKFSANEKTISI